MATTTALITAVSLGLSAIGTVRQVRGAKKAAKASKRAEQLRERQAGLEARRARRKARREAIIAQSEIQANAAGQGVNLASSSIKGGIQSATSQQARQTAAVDKGLVIGQGIFRANAEIASGRSESATGQGISSIGDTIFDRRNSIRKFSRGFTA